MKIIFSAVVLFVFNFSFAQTAKFSTDFQEYCSWDSTSKTFVDCKGSDESTLFTLNKEKTQIIHNTPELKSAYFIDDWNYDADKDVYVYNTTSDVGNKYVFVIDLPHNQIRIMGLDSYGWPYMIRHYVKKYWVEN